ncbi:MAG: hypothetical protein Kow0025_07460 [Thermodesulfovibrionales bacterium]
MLKYRYSLGKALPWAAAVACLFFLALYAADVVGGTYTSTKHGTSADRNVLGLAGFPYATKGHCGHCHEQHSSIDAVEPAPPAAQGPSPYALFQSNYGVNRNELCYACHETLTLGNMPLGYGLFGIYQGRARYEDSVHLTSSQMLWSPDPSPPGPRHEDAGNCNNCHNPHGYKDDLGLIPSMLFAREEAGCEACHDGTQAGAVKDVKSQFNKTYRHPVHEYNDRHVLPEKGNPSGSSFGPANRHAECVDCHNPHVSGPAGAVHVPPGNAVSDAIRGVWGVEPSWPSLWTQPTTFVEMTPPLYPDGSQFEYQVCFKCHSYYGLGALTGGVSLEVGPSGVNITDQAWEFNPNNKSAHPVVVALDSQTGSYAPAPLNASQTMKAPWVAGGGQTMYCSDCHGQENELLDPAGPHGSNVRFMLKGPGRYWPTKSDGTLWRLNTADAGDPNLFCNNCHEIYGAGGWKNNVHSKGDHHKESIACVGCHVAVPHGSKRSRLIGYGSDPAPYNHNGNSLLITGFRKASTPTGYGERNCQTSCHGPHSRPVSGADP